MRKKAATKSIEVLFVRNETLKAAAREWINKYEAPKTIAFKLICQSIQLDLNEVKQHGTVSWRAKHMWHKVQQAVYASQYSSS